MAYFVGHCVPVLAVTMVTALCLNPSLSNDAFMSVNNSCLQDCLQVLGVFVLMECEKCTQASRCAVAYHIHRSGHSPQDAAPSTGSATYSKPYGASRHQGPSLSIAWPRWTAHFLAVLYHCLSRLPGILLHAYYSPTSLSMEPNFQVRITMSMAWVLVLNFLPPSSDGAIRVTPRGSDFQNHFVPLDITTGLHSCLR